MSPNFSPLGIEVRRANRELAGRGERGGSPPQRRAVLGAQVQVLDCP